MKSTVLFYRYHERSWVSATLLKQRFPFPLIPNKPVSRRPYRANPRSEAVIMKCVQDMLNDDIIEGRSSPWGSPVIIVARKDGRPRFCVDYRSTKSTNTLSARPGRWLIVRTTLTWSEAPNLSVSLTSKALIGRFPFTLIMSRLRHLYVTNYGE